MKRHLEINDHVIKTFTFFFDALLHSCHRLLYYYIIDMGYLTQAICDNVLCNCLKFSNKMDLPI